MKKFADISLSGVLLSSRTGAIPATLYFDNNKRIINFNKKIATI